MLHSSECSRATDLTILACPLNMQGMPGALQVLAALLHGVQTIHTYDSNKESNIVGSLDLTVTQVAQATTSFQQALLPHPMWCGPLPVCLVEHQWWHCLAWPRLWTCSRCLDWARVASHNRWAAARTLATPPQQLGPRATMQRRKLPTLSTDAEYARAA